MTTFLQPLHLENLQVLTGTNASLKGPAVVWLRLNTQIDQNVTTYIIDTLHKQYGSQLTVLVDDLTVNNTKISVLNVTNFQAGAIPTPADIQTVLNKIPNTADPSKTSAAPTAVPTTAVKQATATAKPNATATVGNRTPTVVATAKPTPSVPTIPVQVVEARAGSTIETVSLLTSTEVNSDKIPIIKSAIFNGNGSYTYVTSNASVSPSVASETTLRAFLAVLAASVCILLYIWFSFRKVAKPWRYGACAIIALLHDVLVVMGIFSILGWLLDVQVDTLFITAILTVVGFSVHDTIVVFDRIRENMQRRTSETFDQVVNASLVQTMARSLNTSLTVIFTLTALTLFGGLSIRTFTLALLVGIISGTYSSIFNASMLLVIWEKGELGFNRFSRGRTPDGRDARELVASRR
ncbi:MAG: protein translocase subunit SecF [Chloroflexota bacterium]|nr:protein translocase subunit SecF [Chloroflexota bacterium]